MAMTPYSGDTEVISKLGSTPQERGLTAEQFKAKFDEGLKAFVEWFNETHLAELVPEAVKAPTLINGWVNYDEGYTQAGYWKDPLGIVHLNGFIKSGVIPSIAFTLPEGYKPSGKAIFAVNSFGTFGAVTIDNNGWVQVEAGNSSGTNLDGVTFRAGA